MVCIKDKVITPTVEDTCTVYVQEEEIKVEECELKKKMVYIKDKVITHTVEDTCTVYVQGEDVKMENIGIQSEIVLNEEDPLLVGSKITMKRKHERMK
ncbi:uncharacterized protein LOC111697438 isoform X2 [Eurytemora carolleeae]|uniref:uncharacterized protein LOC111697438 isoform X2 n=1 Tax=Eurytemora carolleeae TaxID=1294199 RepID=UPI000C78020C|nr:uncharacterized protein LOC111697438 isoform X2 [Eurytemora carolleeae]|eukprot:XP_023323229.1 uncharacterized protein LOC111697438 isoform X2 [Eurytemora affinis]